MSKKNYAGNIYYRKQICDERLVRKIDRREASGKNRENVDNVYNNYKLNRNGSKT